MKTKNKMRNENNQDGEYSENGKEGRESKIKAVKKGEKGELFSQENNNLENNKNRDKFDLKVVSSRLDCGSVHGEVFA